MRTRRTLAEVKTMVSGEWCSELMVLLYLRLVTTYYLLMKMAHAKTKK
jgi:hypothetical protein